MIRALCIPFMFKQFSFHSLFGFCQNHEQGPLFKRVAYDFSNFSISPGNAISNVETAPERDTVPDSEIFHGVEMTFFPGPI